jgi:hypothetical protein
MNPFEGKLMTGKYYMDTWGNKRLALGYVRGVPKRSIMFTHHGHYNTTTGAGASGQLVNLPPKKELIFWEERLAQIKSSTPADHLAMMQEQLDNIEKRIAALKASHEFSQIT